MMVLMLHMQQENPQIKFDGEAPMEERVTAEANTYTGDNNAYKISQRYSY